jgi:hypothetical protein
MRQPNPKHEVLVKLQNIINCYDDIDLWKEIGKLARTMNYIMLTEDFWGRIALELKVIEEHIGDTKEVKELKDLIASLTVSPSPVDANHSGA